MEMSLCGPKRSLGGGLKCRVCGVALGSELDDDLTKSVCRSCKDRPEAKRLGDLVAQKVGGARGAREFTEAELSLIGRIGKFMPAASLLKILNERLACDLGPDAVLYSMEQLQEVTGAAALEKGPSGDRASLRRLLSEARRQGVLDLVNEQLIDDFAVVFSLDAKQVTVLKDVLTARSRTAPGSASA